MSEEKIQRIKRAKKSLTKHGIEWKEFNSGYHFKIGTLDFWPSTGKWIDGISEGRGLEELLKHLKPSGKAKYLTSDQMFEIVKHLKDRSLTGICDALHKEIYGKCNPS